jgi:hypothetical protein
MFLFYLSARTSCIFKKDLNKYLYDRSIYCNKATKLQAFYQIKQVFRQFILIKIFCFE